VTERNKIRWGWLAFAVVVVHFSMIFIYAFPHQYVPAAAKTAANGYVYPFFEQTWNLFAPCPLINHQLSIRCLYEDDSTGWIDVYKEDQELHNVLRFTYHGDRVLGESNLLFWLEGDMQYLGLSLYEPIPADSAPALKNTMGYIRLATFVRGYSLLNFDKEPLAAEVRCFFENVETRESATIVLPKIEWKK
jgi:hypothetical protein